MIKVEHLVKRYGNRNVVDNLSFTVEKGQIVGFLGPNGAGKSTTMNMITGYISATEGNIEIDGIDIFEEPEKAKKRLAICRSSRRYIRICSSASISVLSVI